MSAAWRADWGAPRLLSRFQVRAYLQLTDRELADRIRKGQLPNAIWGCDPALPSARWDRQAVDNALNRASAVPLGEKALIEELDRDWGLRR